MKEGGGAGCVGRGASSGGWGQGSEEGRARIWGRQGGEGGRREREKERKKKKNPTVPSVVFCRAISNRRPSPASLDIGELRLGTGGKKAGKSHFIFR